MKINFDNKTGLTLWRYQMPHGTFYSIKDVEATEIACMHEQLKNDMIVLWYRLTDQWIEL
jgi:hypothetical protein